MNGIPEEYSLTLTQTSKGQFYVDKLTVKADTETKMLEKIDFLVKEVKERLEKLNVEEK